MSVVQIPFVDNVGMMLSKLPFVMRLALAWGASARKGSSQNTTHGQLGYMSSRTVDSPIPKCDAVNNPIGFISPFSGQAGS